jgi:hypothetical protein
MFFYSSAPSKFADIMNMFLLLDLLLPRLPADTKDILRQRMTVEMIQKYHQYDTCFLSCSHSWKRSAMAGRKVSHAVHELSFCENTGDVRIREFGK